MSLCCSCVFISGFKDASICLCAGFSFRDYFGFWINIWEYLNDVTHICKLLYLNSVLIFRFYHFFLRSVLKNKDLKSDISFLSDKHGLQKQHYYVCIHVTVCGLTTFNFTFSVFCIRVLVFLVILQKSDCGYCGFTCSLKPWRPLSHISPATLTCIRSPPHGREFAMPMCLSNEISLFRLNSRCCSVSWWCLHGQFVPIFPRNGPPLPGPAEGQ